MTQPMNPQINTKRRPCDAGAVVHMADPGIGGLIQD